MPNSFKNKPDGIIITISQEMLKEKGYRNWLRNFLFAMNREGWTYWMRQGSKPKRDILYVYLCIGNKVRYRANYAGTEGPRFMEFANTDGTVKRLYAKAWVLLTGPVVKPIIPPEMKGFQGFRYTEKLF